ncbi:MAG: YbhB/YbcL family Raf kinase inhibitor-like protein [Alphaproteobacteria bacterium]|nr:YbhB/YbcL family Raf kinase inhibitor-like protein [Alphaproteobacteria bacterium]
MRQIWVFAAAAAMVSSAACAADKFTVSSTSIPKDNKLTNTQVFNGFGCKGENKSPALAWKGAPTGTKSFAVTVYDPDAPTGSGWWHWTVFNIPPGVTSLPEGAGAGAGLPAGAVQGRTEFGSAGFGGACPPAGDKPHRYIFKVFALKTDKIELDSNASGALVGFMLNANKLATASYTARYGR